MQTEAEKYLIAVIKKLLSTNNKQWKLINLGAAKSVVVEKLVQVETANFICDRSDVEDCQVVANFVGDSFICPLEDLSPLPREKYDLAFANFVFEHISQPEKASRELFKILKPGGYLVVSLSNPQAPEFILAKITPTWFHQLFRKADHDEAYPVKYAYKNLKNLQVIMAANGFKLIEDKRFAFTYGYLYRWPIIRHLSRFYDYLLTRNNWRQIMSHAVLIWQKV